MAILSDYSVKIQYDKSPEFWKKLGMQGKLKAMRDAEYNFRSLYEAVLLNQPSLFIQYAAWLKTLFVNIGLGKEMFYQTLEAMKETVELKLPAEAAQFASEFIKEAMDGVFSVKTDEESFINEKKPLYDIANEYLRLLLVGNRNEACSLITDNMDNGAGIKDIYLHVFEPCQKEIGRLWMEGRISVAQEHFCTAITQMIMTKIYPRMSAVERKKHSAVSACVENELHEIGLRMVTDLLELDGWNTYYLGANTPSPSIAKMVDDHESDLLLISTTMTIHVDKVANLISIIRSGRSYEKLKIITGGLPFNISHDLYKAVGADGFAKDAADAITVADRLVRRNDD